MGDEHDGIADGSRDERQLEDAEAEEGLAEEDARQLGGAEKGGGGDERKEGRLKVAEEYFDSLPADARDELAEERFMGLVTQWSGELPAPESFLKYPEYAQRAMVSWNDARTIEESKRLDRIVDASIKSVTREQWLTFALNFVFSVLTFAAFVTTGSWVSFGFMAVPAITIAVNFKNSKKKDE